MNNARGLTTMQITEFWAHRSRLRETKTVQRECVALNDGECRPAIDKFALTANNVSYATSGEAVGYWRYFPAEGEPAALRALEDERCLLYPLFATSFIIYDSLLDNDFFGAEQVVIASASSKTAFGLAHLLHHDPEVQRQGKRVVGLTSPGKVDFVQSLDACDQVLAYDELERLDSSVKTAFVDMSGNRELVARVHRHVGANLVDSAMVGRRTGNTRARATRCPTPRTHPCPAPACTAQALEATPMDRTPEVVAARPKTPSRHCEKSEAIHVAASPRLLAMTVR
jgi:hypothetical protein